MYITLEYINIIYSVVDCTFSDIYSLLYECEMHNLMQFEWICLCMIKISLQSVSVMKSMPVTVMLVAQRTVKGIYKAVLHIILTKQGILINKNWILFQLWHVDWSKSSWLRSPSSPVLFILGQMVSKSILALYATFSAAGTWGGGKKREKEKHLLSWWLLLIFPVKHLNTE